LFNEELGAVIQVRQSRFDTLQHVLRASAFPLADVHILGTVNSSKDEKISISYMGHSLYTAERADIQKIWADTSFRMQTLRDDPSSAQQEFDTIGDMSHEGIFYDLTFAPTPLVSNPGRPKVAILREQGVNGHVEMAWAFSAAGFEAVDVHMSDIISGEVSLFDFRGLAACGGFSYGDVLGAGKGWANSALLNETARSEFSSFFSRDTTFALGVCNGCQFISQLRDLIPGSDNWPEFKLNRSERFEARVCVVDIPDNEVTRKSVFLNDMVGSKLPIAVAHGEGQAVSSIHHKRKISTRLVW
jgi:phosphoribosylformylglycinamidine synthase